MAGMLQLLMLFFLLLTENNASKCPNRTSIEQSLVESNIPGAVIVVVNATDKLYEDGFGYHSISPQIPMNVDKSIFTLASISKTFIAVAVMQLVEQHLVDLDLDINQYLSEKNRRIFHPLYPSHLITLRKLLSHSASIAHKFHSWITFYKSDDNAFMEMNLADMCFKYLHENASNWLPEPPGSVTYYSNEGSSLAALVVERVTNMSYDQYVLQNIFKPLNINMKKVGVRLADFDDQEELVKHYGCAANASYLPRWKQLLPHLNLTQLSDKFPTWIQFPFFSFSAYPAGLWRMSAHSLSIFLRVFISQESSILTTKSIIEMRKIVGDSLIPYYQQNSTSNDTIRLLEPHFGLGWYWETTSRGHRYMGHSGTLIGTKHLMLINEKNTIGVIVLTNGDNRQTIYLSRENPGTIANIHLSLFQCFESRSSVNNSFTLRRDATLFRLVYIFTFLYLFSSTNK